MPKNKIKDNAIEDFPSNSKASRVAPIREDRPQSIDETIIEEVEETPKRIAQAVRRKKTAAQSIAQTFFGPEAKIMLQYVFQDVLIPAAKNTIQEMVQSGIEMLLFGETRPHNRRGDKGKTIVSYDRFYGRERNEDRREGRRNSRDRFGLEEIFFDTPKEANDVLEELCEQLEEYEWVTVGDFFELAGIDDKSWINDKWGWNNLKRARCVHVRDGYTIVLPEPKELD